MNFDPETGIIAIDSPWILGSIRSSRRWSVLEFEILVDKLSFKRFDVALSTNTLKFGESVLGDEAWKRVRIEYQPEKRLLTGAVDGVVVTKSTVLKDGLETQLDCRMSSDGGQNAVLQLRGIRIR